VRALVIDHSPIDQRMLKSFRYKKETSTAFPRSTPLISACRKNLTDALSEDQAND
jgi:hypothetical protein